MKSNNQNSSLKKNKTKQNRTKQNKNGAELNVSKVSKVDTRSLTTDLFLLLKRSPLNIRETKRLRAENLGPLVRPHPHSLRSADINEKDHTEEDMISHFSAVNMQRTNP